MFCNGVFSLFCQTITYVMVWQNKFEKQTLQIISQNEKQAPNRYVCNVLWTSGEMSENHQRKTEPASQPANQPERMSWLAQMFFVWLFYCFQKSLLHFTKHYTRNDLELVVYVGICFVMVCGVFVLPNHYIRNGLAEETPTIITKHIPNSKTTSTTLRV